METSKSKENNSIAEFANIIKFDEDNVYVKVKNLKKMDDYTDLLTNLMKMFNYFIEKQKKNNLINFVNVHFDFEKFSLTKLDTEFIKYLFKYLQDNFEDVVKVIYCINISSIFKLALTLFKPFIDKETKDKLKFVKKNKNNKQNEMLSFEEASQVDFEID